MKKIIAAVAAAAYVATVSGCDLGPPTRWTGCESLN